MTEISRKGGEATKKKFIDTPEYREKILNIFKKGNTIAAIVAQGKPHSVERRRKNSEAHLLNGVYLNWRNDPRWETIRLKTFDRDKYTCQKCLEEILTGRNCQAHHILDPEDPKYEKYKFEPTNVITLCQTCHGFITRLIDNGQPRPFLDKVVNLLT